MFVQFSDATEKTVMSYFSSAQDPGVYTNQGTIDASDARWAVYFETLPSFVQEMLPVPVST